MTGPEIKRSDFVSVMGHLATDLELWPDFLALCNIGGRLAGSPSERAARDWAAGRLAAIPGGTLRRDAVAYPGWTCRRFALTELSTGRDLPATPLLGAAATPPEGFTLEVVDCARGAPDQIAAAGDKLRGKAVLVRHEYPFASWTIHRRVKLAAAIEAGAAAFLIAQSEPGIGPVSGSAGMAGAPMIPALGISAEAAARIAPAGSRVRIELDAASHPNAQTETLVLDFPGQGPERVVLSAHIDGHGLAESALDNATGVAAALALARAVAPFVSRMERGLTICLFSAEEWALTGSRIWLDGLSPQQRARILFNLNLDSISGAPSLTALTSGFAGLGQFVQHAAETAGFALAVHEPLMTNSDHANFAAHGIPALRMLAGFDEPGSNLRFLLTGADTRLLTNQREMKTAALIAASVLWNALQAPSASLLALQNGQPSALVIPALAAAPGDP
jgi:aminopeptidase YwaD